MEEITDDEVQVNRDLGTFAIVPDWITTSTVSDRAVRLWAVLWQYADRATGRAWPSHSTLAERLRCSPGTVRRLQKELEQIGALTVQHRYSEGVGQRSNLITLHVMQRTLDTTPPITSEHPPIHTCATPPPPVRDRTRTKEQEPNFGDKSQRKRDDLFDSLVEVCRIDTASLTTSARGAANRAIKELRVVGATAEQIHQAARAYRTQYPTAAVTPSALAKHWPQLIESAAPARQLYAERVNCTDCDGTGWSTPEGATSIAEVTRCERCGGFGLES